MIATVVFLLLLSCVLLLHIFSLPANWIVLALALGWKWLHPGHEPGWWVLIGLAALAGVAELLELGAQVLGAKRFGSTGRGNLGGIVGAIAGAILGAPLFFGLGALFGALLGAFTGCLLIELGQGRRKEDAFRAAWGAFFGKFFGLAIKFSLGAAMIVILGLHIWPRG